jgi:hypothetical protein
VWIQLGISHKSYGTRVIPNQTQSPSLSNFQVCLRVEGGLSPTPPHLALGGQRRAHVVIPVCVKPLVLGG